MTGVVKDDGVNFFSFIIISNFSLVDVDKKKKLCGIGKKIIFSFLLKFF